KTQTEIARKREKEMGDLYAFSRRGGGGALAAPHFPPVPGDLGRPLHPHGGVLWTRGARGRGGPADQSAVLPRGDGAGVGGRAGRTLPTTVDDGAGDIWLVRRVSQKNADFGVIAIDLGSVPPSDIDEVRKRVDDVLSDAAATLERLDVARALNDAKMRSETEL